MSCCVSRRGSLSCEGRVQVDIARTAGGGQWPHVTICQNLIQLLHTLESSLIKLRPKLHNLNAMPLCVCVYVCVVVASPKADPAL